MRGNIKDDRNNRRTKGFTIVELVVSIVVIGLLATISLMGYGGWKDSVLMSKLKSDIRGAASAMENGRNFSSSGEYSTSIPSTFHASSGVTMWGGANFSDRTIYCLEAQSQENTDLTIHVLSSNGLDDYFDGGCPSGYAHGKPVVYLYPTSTQDVKVRLDFEGRLTNTYPEYDKKINGWEVTANPDGSLINHADGMEYSYLFWEGINSTDYEKYFTDGFVVKGSDTKNFLQSILSKIGLTPKEYNEMIVFWLPKMQVNKYNFIRFAGEEYTDKAKLTITPTPDSILRVFMVYKPVEKYIQVPEQKITPFERKGFTVVEWGGAEIN